MFLVGKQYPLPMRLNKIQLLENKKKRIPFPQNTKSLLFWSSFFVFKRVSKKKKKKRSICWKGYGGKLGKDFFFSLNKFLAASSSTRPRKPSPSSASVSSTTVPSTFTIKETVNATHVHEWASSISRRTGWHAHRGKSCVTAYPRRSKLYKKQ